MHGHRTVVQKKVIVVFNVHIVIIVQKRHFTVALEKVAFLRATCQTFGAFGAKYGISEITELNFSVVNIF